MAQKVGEEGVEVALAAVTQDNDRLIGESADLLFHLTLLLKRRDLSLGSVRDWKNVTLRNESGTLQRSAETQVEKCRNDGSAFAACVFGNRFRSRIPVAGSRRLYVELIARP